MVDTMVGIMGGGSGVTLMKSLSSTTMPTPPSDIACMVTLHGWSVSKF